MSWVRAALSSEDVFDENADETSLQSKEWNSNMKKRFRVMRVFRICCVLCHDFTSLRQSRGATLELSVGFNTPFPWFTGWLCRRSG